MRRVAIVCLLVACGPPPRTGSSPDGAAPVVDTPDADPCPPPPGGAPAGVELAAPFDMIYRVYDLGAVPGVPNPLGGTVVRVDNNDVLLVAGASETPDGAIYSIGLTRDSCNHIIGFQGTATVVANTPYVDANLIYMRPDLLVYTEWPQYTLSQLATGSMMPDRRTDLRMISTPAIDSSPGGLGRVPPSLAPAGELRLVTWPSGGWYHVTTAPDGSLLAVNSLTVATTLPNQPGGFAYVPEGSPGFPIQSVIVAEWRTESNLDRVAVYEVDAAGDPVVATRREFFKKFPRPWGAYFEPVTGDYLFLSWGAGDDHVYVVQGFVPPPVIL